MSEIQCRSLHPSGNKVEIVSSCKMSYVTLALLLRGDSLYWEKNKSFINDDNNPTDCSRAETAVKQSTAKNVYLMSVGFRGTGV